MTDEVYAHLAAHFPGAISRAARRDGHEGLVVAADRLTEVARHIRDEMGYNHLSSVTAVDYAEDGYYEVVYHAYSTERGGGPLVFKARADAAIRSCLRWSRSGRAPSFRSERPGI